MTSKPFSLFSTPSTRPASNISPRVFPGVTPASTTSLSKNLEDNHYRWHCFFNDKKFHNHSAHWQLAIWSLGASPAVLDAAYAHGSSKQRNRKKSPGPITATNWTDHLGDEKYYSSYVEFFTEVVKENGIANTVEQYVFSNEANIQNGNVRPAMLARFYAFLIHSFINIGYGFEFDLPGMVIGGLAITAVNVPDSNEFFPDSFFRKDFGAEFEKLKIDGSTKGVHAFDVIARILKEPSLDNLQRVDEMLRYPTIISNHAETIKRYAEQWTMDLSIHEELERKIEELVWTVSVLYGAGGWAEGQEYSADFFLMHLVTSSLFLSSITAQLKPQSQERLLRSYFVVILAWWVSTGRPGPNIRGLFAAATDYLVPVCQLPTPDQAALPSRVSPDAVTPNPWLPIIETALVYPEDHLPKLQRALAHYGAIYGSRAAGELDFKETELEGAELLDGTLFLRAAGLTAKKLGRVREGEKLGYWEDKGFFKA